MADPFTNCRCGQNGAGGITGIVDQNGNVYPGGQVPTIPNYGPHPPLKASVSGPLANPTRHPFGIAVDPNNDHCFAIVWEAEQQGRSLIAADGETVLYTAPAESEFCANGATSTPTTIGGILTTPGGTAGHKPVMVLALSSDNPPPFTINSDTGEIEGLGVDPLQRCTREWPTRVMWEDGPGAVDANGVPVNTAPNYVIDNEITFVCVESDSPNEDTGNLVLWHTELDQQGVWQWHSNG